ncbi:MAG: sigma-70 family RNA polymerase sigma factor [Bacteroidetes bacterium]|nr:sigma-70 family RNA polymerase sigma factor [Bacteroidota bacterium]MCL5737317.1 sigma-70 family RNA polymerase sigma factor [Bacteroidota bacterium]
MEDDTKLIEASKAGDKRAFGKLVKKYEQLVYSFSFKICRDKDKADEVLQETFVNAYRGLKSFSGNSKFSTWLYRIVTNNCLMMHRKESREPVVSLDEANLFHGTDELQIPHWGETPQDSVLNKELKEILDEAIQKLPLDYRIVFVMRDVEGLSTEEVGKALKLSVPAVKSRLHRARLFLREELNPYFAK